MAKTGERWLSAAEVRRYSGASPRMLQWWDEQGHLRATHEGHRRFYTLEQAECARAWVRLRKHVRFRFGSPIDKAIRVHRNKRKIVFVRRGHFKLVNDTLVIATW